MALLGVARPALIKRRTKRRLLGITAGNGGGVVIPPDTIPDAFAFTSPAAQPAFSTVNVKPNAPLSGYDTPIPFGPLGGGIKFSIDNGTTLLTEGTIPIPATLGNNFVVQFPVGAAGSSTPYTPVIGGVPATSPVTITAQAAANIASINGTDLAFWGDGTDTSTMFQDRQGTMPIVPNGTQTQRTVRRINDKGGSGRFAYVLDGQAAPIYSATAFGGGTQPGLLFPPGAGAWMRIDALPITPSTFHATMSVEPYAKGVATEAEGGGRWMSLMDPAAAANDDYGQPKCIPLFGFFDNGQSGSNAGLGGPMYANGSNISNNISVPYNVASRMSAELTGTSGAMYVGTTIGGTAVATTFALANPSNIGIMANPKTGDNKAAGRVQQFFIRFTPPTNQQRLDNENYLAGLAGPTSYTINLAEKNAATTNGVASSGAGQIVLNNGHNFVSDDWIIIPASTGMGTIGPGGFQTDMQTIGATFANEAAVLAATSSTSGTYARETTTNKLYLAKSDGTGYLTWDQGDYYRSQTRPKSLSVQVTVSGNTLTFKNGVQLQAAVPSGTAITLDQNPWLASQMTGPANATFTIKGTAGATYSMSPNLAIGGKNGWTISFDPVNAFTIKAPPGMNGSMLSINGCTSPTVYLNKLILKCNHQWGPSVAPGITFGAYFTSCSDAAIIGGGTGYIEDPTATGVAFQYSSRGTRTTVGGTPFKLEDGTTPLAYFAQAVEIRRNQSHQQYLAHWAFDVIDTGSLDGGAIIGEFRDCKFTGVGLSRGFETVRSRGAVFTRPMSVNGLIANNSSGDTKILDLDLSFTPNCRDLTVAAPERNIVLIDINSNLQNSSGSGASGGGVLTIKSISMPGWLDNTGWVPTLMTVNPPGWTITGTVDPEVKDDGLRKGVITMPAPKAGGTFQDYNQTANGPVIILNNGDYYTVSGLALKQTDTTTLPGQDTFPGFTSGIRTSGANLPNTSVTKTVTGKATPVLNIPGGTAPTSGTGANRSGDYWAARP